jgi:hypothetical protein
VSEIYGSRGHDSGDDMGRRGSDYPGSGSRWGNPWGGPWRSDHSVYDRDVPDHDTGDDGAGDYYDLDPDAENYADIDAVLTRRERQGTTGGEHAEDARDQQPDAGDTDREGTGGIDSDICAILHENGHLPEPCTRDEVAREATARYCAPGLTETGASEEAYEPHQSWESDLPTREEPRAKIWGSDAECWDENKQTWRKFDAANPDVSLADDDGKARTSVGKAEHATSELASQGGVDSGQAADTGDAWDQRVSELETANAELQSENTQLSKGITKLEIENADLGKRIVELDTRNDTLESRLERLERSVQAKPAALDTSREVGDQEVAAKEAKQQSGRPEWSSNEAIALGAAAGSGILTTAADYWSCLPATYAGITASVLGVGAAAVALIRRQREGKDGPHRPEN